MSDSFDQPDVPDEPLRDETEGLPTDPAQEDAELVLDEENIQEFRALLQAEL